MKPYTDDDIRPLAQLAYEYRVSRGFPGSQENDWELGREYLYGAWEFLSYPTYLEMAFSNKLDRKRAKMLKEGGY